MQVQMGVTNVSEKCHRCVQEQELSEQRAVLAKLSKTRDRAMHAADVLT